MELLRIVTMILVMIVHASNRALPRPDINALNAAPVSVFLQLSTVSFSVMGVNVFVLLSGWYGIHPRLNRLGELFFQLLFFGILCLGVEYMVSSTFPPKAFTSLFLLTDNTYWFIKVYIALYLFAPMLNNFVDTASNRQIETLLIAAFSFQFVFGWIFEATSWLCAGYSLPSFMCLYLLARYMHVYKPVFTQFKKSTDLLIFVGICLFVSVSVFFLRHYNLGGFLFFYNCPFVILESVYLLLFFSKLSFSNNIINWIAISAFSIYLTHSNCFLAKYYDVNILKWYKQEPWLFFVIYVILLIIIVFVVSIIIDKIRIVIWNKIIRNFKIYI